MVACRPPPTAYVERPAEILTIHTEYRKMQKEMIMKELLDSKHRLERATEDMVYATNDMRRSKQQADIARKAVKLSKKEQKSVIETAQDQKKEAQVLPLIQPPFRFKPESKRPSLYQRYCPLCTLGTPLRSCPPFSALMLVPAETAVSPPCCSTPAVNSHNDLPLSRPVSFSIRLL